MTKKIYVLTESMGEDVSICGVFDSEDSLKAGVTIVLGFVWHSLARDKMRREGLIQKNPTMTIQELHDATIQESVDSLCNSHVLRTDRFCWRIKECNMNEVIE